MHAILGVCEAFLPIGAVVCLIVFIGRALWRHYRPFPYTGRLLGTGYRRAWWADIQQRYYLDRIRHPRELTWREWLAHGRMLVLNLALLAAMFCGMWWVTDRFNPQMAPSMAGLAVGGMLADWLYGKYRKERPKVREIAHGEFLQSGTAFKPPARRP